MPSHGKHHPGCRPAPLGPFAPRSEREQHSLQDRVVDRAAATIEDAQNRTHVQDSTGVAPSILVERPLAPKHASHSGWVSQRRGTGDKLCYSLAPQGARCMKRLPSKSPDVVFQRVTDGAVLLATGTEVYFGLDPVGTQIWELLPPVQETLDGLSDALAERYPEVAIDTIRADAEELLAAMLRAGLVVGHDHQDAGDTGQAGPT